MVTGAKEGVGPPAARGALLPAALGGVLGPPRSVELRGVGEERQGLAEPGFSSDLSGWSRDSRALPPASVGARDCVPQGPVPRAAMTKQRPLSLAGQSSLSELYLQPSPQCLDATGHCLEGGRHWKSRSTLWTREVPLSMPWSGINRGAVTFIGSMMPTPRDRCDFPGFMKIKRRSEAEGDGPSRKHFLSEDAMAAQFTSLSLSNDHVYGSNGFPITKGEGCSGHKRSSQDGEARSLPGAAEEDERKDVIVEGMFDMSDSRVIVMSPDLQRRLQCPPEDILPREVLQSMSEKCMELILWQSPGHLIQRAIRSLRLSGDDTQWERETERGAEPRDTPQPGEHMEL
ncbi:uncharacterized protein LOC144489763 [Mustelus asterias]